MTVVRNRLASTDADNATSTLKPILDELFAAPAPVTDGAGAPPTPSPVTPAPQPAPAPTPVPAPLPVQPAPVTPAPAPAPTVPSEPPPDRAPPAEAPQPQPQPQPQPPAVEAPFAETRPAPAVEVVDGSPLVLEGGRVSLLRLPDLAPGDRVVIETQPSRGHVSVNPDNSIAVVMSGSDHAGPVSISYRILHDGSPGPLKTIAATVAAPVQAEGWGLGGHYMLETDRTGALVIETGDNHRPIYVSGGRDGLTAADIAAREGIAATAVTAAWLRANPEYGASEALALSTALGSRLWTAITGERELPGSHWLLLKAGHSYDLGRVIGIGAQGESPLHPLHITAYGDGPPPIITSEIKIFQKPSENIVISNVALQGGIFDLTGSNIILDNVDVSRNSAVFQQVDNITLRNSTIAHVVAETPAGDFWNESKAGLYMADGDGILIEGSIFHHNGWEDDYRRDGSTLGGMPPTMFSHNVYLQYDTTDVTFRDNIVSQGASYGAHIRGGGVVSGNVFVDNNAAVDILGGVYDGHGPVGNFSLVADNVVTSAGYKVTDRFNGALSWGIDVKAYATTLIDNIVAHLANPDDPREQAAKASDGTALYQSQPAAYDDTIVFNWNGSNPMLSSVQSDDRNTEGLDTGQAMATTIQRYAAALLGDSDATIAELMDFLIARADAPGTVGDAARSIIDYFQDGFGLSDVVPDSASAAVRFAPHPLADGVRWDIAMNWAGGVGPANGARVDLAGNHVRFAGTTRVESLDLGTNGRLDVDQGRLQVGAPVETGKGGIVAISHAGQFWTNGFRDADALRVQIDEGRFANTGSVLGPMSIDASGGQVLLAAGSGTFVLGGGQQLRLNGSDLRVGFDGASNGSAVLRMTDGAQLQFRADAGGLAEIGEFRSGRYGDSVAVQSRAVLDGTLQIDLSAAPAGGRVHDLIDVDTLLGRFDAIRVNGLRADHDATVIIDYDRDMVKLMLESGGSGDIDTVLRGTPTADEFLF